MTTLRHRLRAGAVPGRDVMVGSSNVKHLEIVMDDLQVLGGSLQDV